jgi:tRNA dimethylallyltransferase
MSTEEKVLVVVTGSTASGKTPFSIRLASRYKSEIISADSRQFYREMPIGTAAPSPEEVAIVPHHFVGHLSVRDPYNVSRFETDAMAKLGELFSRSPVAVLVGGSGLYIDAVCRGIDLLPDPDADLRKELRMLLEKEGIGALQRRLAGIDFEYYRVVDRLNPARLIRAIEVTETVGIPYSALRTRKPKARPFRVVKIALQVSKDELDRRIGVRVDAMRKAGLLQEATLLYPLRHLNALNTVGYRELFDHFDGRCSLDEAVDKIKTNTRRYAKRQMTWLRRDESVRWLAPGVGDQAIDVLLSPP